MELSYIYYQDGAWYVGFLYGFPDYWTQGENIAELEMMIYIAGSMSLNFLSPVKELEMIPFLMFCITVHSHLQSQTNLSIHGGIYGYYQNC